MEFQALQWWRTSPDGTAAELRHLIEFPKEVKPFEVDGVGTLMLLSDAQAASLILALGGKLT